jgi:acetyltransferase-like isoleucine patch superfamily enzyme
MTSTLHPEAEIAPEVVIGPNAVIGRAILEEGVVLGAGVVIHDNVWLRQGVRVYDNSVLGRRPQVAGIIQRKPKTDLPWLDIGAHSVIGANVVLYTGTSIGTNTLIGDLASIREECSIGNNVVIGRGVMINYAIEIHDRVRIMDGSHFGGDMVIESDVFVGPHVSSANDNAMGIAEQSVRQGPRIRRGASIGVGAILLANIEIGEQAVIGAGALVDRSIPARMIAVGVPARVLKAVPPELLRPIENALEVA